MKMHIIVARDEIVKIDGKDRVMRDTDSDATRDLNEAIDQVLEFWASGTAVYSSSLAALDLIKAVENSRRERK